MGATTELPDGPIRILVSSCLLGEKVRYDGGHKRDPFLVATLGRFVEYVPVCPEVECGLPTPREAMRLVGDPDFPRLVTAKTVVDHTRKMQGRIRTKLDSLKGPETAGIPQASPVELMLAASLASGTPARRLLQSDWSDCIPPK